MSQTPTLWYIRVNEANYGPYDSNQLRQLAKNNQINSQTLILKQGTQKWIPASQIKGLLDGGSTTTGAGGTGASAGAGATTPQVSSGNLPASTPSHPTTAPSTAGGWQDLGVAGMSPGQPVQTPTGYATQNPTTGNPATPGNSANPYASPSASTSGPTVGSRQIQLERLDVREGYVKLLGSLLYGMLGILFLFAVTQLIAKLMVGTMLFESGFDPDRPDAAFGMLFLVGCMVILLGIAAFFVIVAIAVTLIMIWQTSASSRKNGYPAIAIGCMVFGVIGFFGIFVLAFGQVQEPLIFEVIGWVAGGIFAAYIIPIALMIERWQKSKRRPAVKHLSMIVCGCFAASMLASAADLIQANFLPEAVPGEMSVAVVLSAGLGIVGACLYMAAMGCSAYSCIAIAKR